MKNLWQIIAVVLFIAFFWFTKCSGSASGEKSTEINIKNVSEVQNFIQGKWQMAYYPQSGMKVSVRFLIEGNTIKAWSSTDDNWEMNQAPEEVYTFKIGDLSEEGTSRDIEWDDNGDLTLQQRAIGDIYVHSEFDFCFNGRGVADFFDKGWK